MGPTTSTSPAHIMYSHAKQRIQLRRSPKMYPLFILSILLLFFLFPKYPSSTPTTLPLHHTSPSPPSRSLRDLATSSLRRARHIKNPQTAPHSTRTPLSPHSYGGHSVTLNFGTPPQPIPFLLDTGSELTWLPCTKSYLCRDCPDSIAPFLPKLSSTSRLVGCANPKCYWIHDSRNGYPNCTSRNQTCSPYFVAYGSGSTAGLLLSETLRVNDLQFNSLGIGCSVVSDRQPAGIAGFGRGPASLPSQLKLRSFGYCLVSRRYDDSPRLAGSLVLDGDGDGANATYTKFIKNPVRDDNVFSVYYYVALRKITVGGKKVRLPRRALVPGADGSGGVIIDSGTTFTYLESSAFGPLLTALVESVGGEFKRSAAVEEESGLRPCFEMGSGKEAVRLPEMVLHFKGGAEMKLPVENYFAFAGNSTATVCLTVVSDGGDGRLGGGGPSIILGNFQQQNYYVEYDLERERLGFRQRSCLDT